MAIDQAYIDALKLAIVSSQLRVRFSDGREVEYRSVQEMKDALTFAQNENAKATSGSLPFCKSNFAGVTRY